MRIVLGVARQIVVIPVHDSLLVVKAILEHVDGRVGHAASSMLLALVIYKPVLIKILSSDTRGI